MITICICGAGTMGSGIAQVAAASGYPTVLYDVSPDITSKARSRLETDLAMLVSKQKITGAQKAGLLQHLRFTTDISDCKGGLVIEAIVEKMEVKVSLFRQLASINGPETIFASNTSSLSISAIAEKVPGPERMAGLHFFNPAPVMKLVEIVKGEKTSEEVISRLLNITRSFHKTPVVCKDSPGFIVNRVARPYYIESLRLLESGMADLETIDQLMEARGFRMGPFRLMDLIGNDINYAVSCSVYEQLHEPARLKPSFIQKEKVEQGALGKKTGKGYYNYEGKK